MDNLLKIDLSLDLRTLDVKASVLDIGRGKCLHTETVTTNVLKYAALRLLYKKAFFSFVRKKTGHKYSMSLHKEREIVPSHKIAQDGRA